MVLTKRLDSKNQRLLDYEGYHPNIQAAKSIHASVRYLRKSDTDPLAYKINLEDLLQSVHNKKRILSDTLAECKSNA